MCDLDFKDHTYHWVQEEMKYQLTWIIIRDRYLLRETSLLFDNIFIIQFDSVKLNISLPVVWQDAFVDVDNQYIFHMSPFFTRRF